MKRSRAILVGVLALGLAGSVSAAAAASPSQEPTPKPGASCPPPGEGKELDTVQVKDGKVYFNGKEVGTASASVPLMVAVKDGKVYVGEEAKKIAPPPGSPGVSIETEGAGGTVAGGGSDDGPVPDAVPSDGPVTGAAPSDGPVKGEGPVIVRRATAVPGDGEPGAGHGGLTCAIRIKEAPAPAGS